MFPDSLQRNTCVHMLEWYLKLITVVNTYEHNHVKHGDIVLKYALTCAVRGAILANKNSSIKLFYRKISKKGVSPQKAQIAAARKMACIVWKVLSSKQPYTATITVAVIGGCN